MERPSEGREQARVEDSQTGSAERDRSASPVVAPGNVRHAPVESSGRPRASMILWLVVAAAVAVGVALYFIYGSSITPLFGTPQ